MSTEPALTSGEGLRLSPQQRVLWTGRSRSNPPAVAGLLSLDGPLDAFELRRKLTLTVARHEILRTVFRLLPGLRFPVQVIADDTRCRFQDVDLSALGPRRQRQALAALWLGVPAEPFDLAAGPLFRVTLVRLGGARHRLLLVLPALCADTRTIKNLAVALAEAGEDREPATAPLIQYADFAEWQNELLESDDAEEGRGHWRQQAWSEASAPVGALFPRAPDLARWSPDTCARTIPFAALAPVLAAEDWRLEDLALAAWHLLLCRLTGQSDLALGLVLDGRKHEPLRATIGPCAKAVPVRARVEAGWSVREAVRRAGESLAAATDYQEYYEGVAAGAEAPLPWLGFECDGERADASAGALTFAVERVVCRAHPFALKLFCNRRGAALDLQLLYDRCTLAPELVLHLADSLETLLLAAAGNPAARVGELPLVGEAARHLLAVEWNDWPPFTRDSEVSGAHQLFERWAAKAPEALAVVAAGLQLTYGELDRRANGLARRLRLQGVGSETRVAIALEPSLELPIALLAVWKAGGAFVPLDLEMPAARRAHILSETRPAVLVTASSQATAASGFAGRVVLVDRPERGGEGRRPAVAEPPAGESRPEDLAYIVHTSGSTGRPKGVMSVQRGVVRYLEFLVATYGLGPGDRVLQVAPLTFDASVRDLIGPLTAGATVVLPGRGFRDPNALLRDLRGHQVTHLMSVVPSLLRALCDAGSVPSTGARGSLRQVLVSGERLFAAGCVAARAAFGGELEVVNQYGPTECTMTSSYWRATAELTLGVAPLGRPIPGARFVVLDRELEPVPPGVYGELYIAGPGLARGYLGRPDLTAERFVPGAHGGGPGERCYRTGDLVRRMPNGLFEFGGRFDQQVKVRGHRVELGEVEAALAAHPALREVAVTAVEGTPDGVRLVAYLVPTPGAGGTLDAAELRRFLAAELPEAMIPSSFIQLPALPRNAHGKVDRRALPAPGAMSGEELRTVRPSRAPATPTEEIVAGICMELLKLPRVGIEENFFELGGHSLLAARFAARVSHACGIELSLPALFKAGSLAELAACVDQALALPGSAALPPLARVSRERPLPLSFSQRRLWFLAQLEPASSAYNMPLIRRLLGPLDAAALAAGLAAVVRRHEVLRTVYAESEGEPVQVVAEPASPLLPLIDLAMLPGPRRGIEALELAAAGVRRPFDLAAGPVLRGALLRLGDRDHIAWLNLHHIAGDDWSMGILLDELARLYAAGTGSGASATLPELPLQYGDFAAWQRATLNGESLAAHLAVWRRRLAGAPPALDLPTDRPRPAAPGSRGAVRAVAFAPALTASLRAFGRREGSTLFMTLLAAFQALLGRHSGREDFCVGTPVAGRHRGELDRLIGCFVNTLVLRADLSADVTVRELLGRVRRVCLEAQAHAEMPFEVLVDELKVERDLGSSPLFQVMFTLLNAPRPTLGLPGLSDAPVAMVDERRHFELELLLGERDGRLEGILQYDPDLLDAATAERLIGHLETWLAGALIDPDRRISQVPWMGDAELHQLTVEWHGTGRERPEASFPELFLAQAERAPDAVAVAYGESHRSYRELMEEVARAASRLVALGVGRQCVVAVLVERNLELPLALLAVLSAGGVYLPLDPHHPAPRLRSILADSGAALVLLGGEGEEAESALHAAVAELPPERRPATARCADLAAPGGAGKTARARASAMARRAAPDDLAYVIYTSGSTGAPKGAMIDHRGMLNHLLLKVEDLGLSDRDLVAQTAAITFDISIWQLLSILLAGGTVRIFGDEVTLDAGRLLAEVDSAGVTVLEVVPSQLRALFAELDPEGRPRLAALRWLISNGEALPHELGRTWSRLYPHASLINTYGATECSDDVTHHHAGTLREAEGAPAHVPTGRPLANLRLYVLDRLLAPVAIGIEGEIVVGGAGVGRGYWGEARRTAAAFVPDPWSEAPGCRLYRTGDRGRMAADGTCDILGRIDHQVKIRGFRIELGEVESALAACPGVAEGAVAVCKDGGGGDRLVAYFAVQPGETTSPADLRASLERRLPGHMVPAVYVQLAALPLNANGKLDRKALPAPDSGQVAGATAGREARTPGEELLAGLWAELLHLERVSADGDFFELGGHSLLATQLMSRVRRQFGVELPLRALFEEPTPAGLMRRIAAARRVEEEPPVPPLAPAGRDRPLVLSFGQQRLWFLDQLEPGSAAYNINQAITFDGDLALPVLAGAMAEIVRRHESLRTHFATAGGRPLQVVERPGSLPLATIDLSALPAVPRELEIARLAAAEALAPFDLARGPLWRTSLLRQGDRRHVLLVTLHHIIADAWSLEVLVEELSSIYSAFAAGRPSSLPELAVQYADYAHWQRQWLQGRVLATQLDFWRRRLAGAAPVLALPIDRPRGAGLGDRGAAFDFALAPALSRALQALSRRHGATLFMTLLTSFEALLSRCSGQEDFCLGTPIAGRHHLETEGLIGLLVNTLVMRARLAGSLGFLPLLAQTREMALDAHAHQDLPFEKLVEELAPDRSLSHTPLFQVVFVLQNVRPRRFELPGLSIGALMPPAATAKFDLVLSMHEEADRLTGQLLFRTDLFDLATVARMAAQLERLLAAAAADPAVDLAAVPLLGAAEREALLRDPPACPPIATSLHRCFEESAARAPEAVAVIFGEERVTYGELAARASRLAGRLRASGIGPEARVGLCVERSTALVVGVLAILKAGGAYVPLDPLYPRERLDYLVADSGVQALLGDAAALATLAAGRALPHLLIESGREPIAAGEQSGHPAAGGVRWEVPPESAAYVIYTSGSTGRPKGVVVSHANVLRLFRATDARFGFGEADAWTLFHSYAFDFSVWEMWGALLHGGRLVIVPRPVALTPPAFYELLCRERVTVLNQTPSAFRQLSATVLAAPDSSELALRWVIFGGEALELESLRPWFERFGGAGARLVNMFGITETTVHVTWRALSPADCQGAAASAIGGPIEDLKMVLLDRRGEPVPEGVAGELYVGGAGLARGYLGRPALTAERFRPDPFSSSAGQRLYRSGDLARRVGRDFHYLGRTDQQVKIRGFRIELGEVESELNTLPEVRAAACLCRDDPPQGRRLVAYVVAPQASPGELRRALARRLPQPMVPAAFVFLEALPLTENGKVDRAALASSASLRPDAGEPFVRPSTPVEETLAGLYEDVLQLDRVGVMDNFFDLGGHSLLATQLISRVRESLGLELPVRELFLHPTVGELGLVLAAKMLQREDAAAPPIPPVPAARERGDEPPPLSFAQERFWLLDRLQPGNPAYNVSQALALHGALALPVLTASLAVLVERHEALRTTFPVRGEQAVQSIAPAAPRDLPLIDLAALAKPARERESRRLAVSFGGLPFDLARGPLLRTALVRLAEASHVLLLAAHHIVCDGWSLGVFTFELSVSYRAFADGLPSPLPALSWQYADYAVWQRRWLSGRTLAVQQDYWRRQLAGVRPLLDLPTDRGRPEVLTYTGRDRPLALAGDLTGRLRRLGRSSGGTLYMVLLAAWSALLSLFSGSEDLVIGSSVANRTHLATERLIGCFFNLLALRIDLTGGPTFRELLSRVQEVVLGAFSHQHLPFEKVLEIAGGARSTSYTPLVQVCFELNNAPDARLELPGLRVEPLAGRQPDALFDLVLILGEREAGLEGVLRYNAELFSDGTASGLACALETLLADAARNPDKRVGQLATTATDAQRGLAQAFAAELEIAPFEVNPPPRGGVVAEER